MNVKCLNTHVILRRSRRISYLILGSQPEAGRPLADFNSVSLRMTGLTFCHQVFVIHLAFELCHLDLYAI